MHMQWPPQTHSIPTMSHFTPTRVADRHAFDTLIDARSPAEFALDHLPGGHVLSSSFGAQAAVSLHMATRPSLTCKRSPHDRHNLFIRSQGLRDPQQGRGGGRGLF